MLAEFDGFVPCLFKLCLRYFVLRFNVYSRKGHISEPRPNFWMVALHRAEPLIPIFLNLTSRKFPIKFEISYSGT